MTVIGITGLGGFTSTFGLYLDSTMQVYIHRLRFLDSNAYKLKKYILLRIIVMLRLLLPSEDDSLPVDKNSLVYQTHSLIGYATKERNFKFRPCHGKSLVEIAL